MHFPENTTQKLPLVHISTSVYHGLYLEGEPSLPVDESLSQKTTIKRRSINTTLFLENIFARLSNYH